MKVLEVTILKIKVKKVTTRNIFSQIKNLSKTSPKKLAKLLEYTLEKNPKQIVEKWQYLWKKALVTTI